MGRPRYQVNRIDWLDCLDWLEYQCSRADWYAIDNHPVHDLGVAQLKGLVRHWRNASRPSNELLEKVQSTLNQVLLPDDWARLRKALSARKRRRKEAQLEDKPVNITLTKLAHRYLADYRDLTNSETLSDALMLGLQQAMSEALENKEHALESTIRAHLNSLSQRSVISAAQQYLAITDQRKTLANSSRFAMQVFMKRREASSFSLLNERFIEDLVWNELHLNMSFKQLDIWDES